MALAKGDYIILAEKIVEALKADTDQGGLCELGNPAVKTIEPKIRRESKLYSKYELPLIGIEVVRKKELPSPNAKVFDKVFEVEFLILCRGGDREAEAERAKKIAHRLEKVLIEQNQAQKQFSGLAREVADAQGVIFVQLKETRFESKFFEEGTGKKPEVSALVRADLIIPCSRSF